MTVSSELNRKEYAGNDVTVAFATSPVVFFDEADLEVYVVVDATGVATLKTITTHYTVSGGSGSTGTVTMLTAPATGETLVIVRSLALLQEVDLVNNDSSDAEVLEDALDKLTMMAQQNSASIDRSFKLADSDTSGASTEIPTPEASALIGWSDDGTELQNYTTDVLDSALTTAFTITLLDDADADAFVQTLVDGATAITSPAIGDTILLSDVSETPDDGRKITLENTLKVVNGLTEDTTPDFSADFVLSYDASAAAAKKIGLDTLLPAGIVMDYAGSSVPTGWLECDGAAVSRATYPALFTAIGTTWGAGDGSTTFNLPPSAGRSRIGRGTGTVVASGVDADVDIVNNGFVVSANDTKWITGMSFVFTLASGTITGLTSGNTYYAIRSSSTLVKIASSLANAQSESNIDLTAKSSPVWSITHTYTARTLGQTGGEEAHAQSSTELLAHTHALTNHLQNSIGQITAGGTVGGDAGASTTQSRGGNAAMNIMSPFGVYMQIIRT
jgi:microcystin-dependent protein